jgi:hypothetical protein
VRTASDRGPIEIAADLQNLVRALDPTSLGEDDFDGLLAAVGMGGDGAALPDRMAEINAILDIAAPALREALLVAFLDRLARPLRRTAEVAR